MFVQFAARCGAELPTLLPLLAQLRIVPFIQTWPIAGRGAVETGNDIWGEGPAAAQRCALCRKHKAEVPGGKFKKASRFESKSGRASLSFNNLRSTLFRVVTP